MLFRGPRGIVAGTSGNEKKAGTSGNWVLRVPLGIPKSLGFIGFTLSDVPN